MTTSTIYQVIGSVIIPRLVTIFSTSSSYLVTALSYPPFSFSVLAQDHYFSPCTVALFLTHV
jgi:hypothetical protein